jgi:hypothetical protein
MVKCEHLPRFSVGSSFCIHNYSESAIVGIIIILPVPQEYNLLLITIIT